MSAAVTVVDGITKVNGGIDMKSNTYSWGSKTLALVLSLFMIFSVVPMAAAQAATAGAGDKAVEYMRSMATVKWTPKKNITYWSGGSRKFTAGTTYRGMPYTQNNRQNLAAFKKYVNSSNVYTGPSTSSSYVGNDCSSAVRFAWLNVGAKITFSYTGNMFPGSKTGVLAVGSYKSTASTSSTKIITTGSGASTMYSAYAQLKAGDAVFARVNGVVNHARLVSDVKVVKNSNGSVNGSSSYVKCIEQCGLSSSRGNTTWNVDKKYTFSALYSTYYIPITCQVVKDGGSSNGASKLKIAANNYPTSIFEGKEFSIYGVITSNYTIKKVTVTICDASGKAVSSKTVKPNAKSYELKKIASSIKFSKAKAGKNYYKVVATDAKKTKTLVNRSFTVKKAADVSNLKIKNYNYPNASINQGTTFVATGKATSNYNIKSITLAVYNSSAKAVYTKTTKPNAKSYDISKISSALKFNLLASGSYTYRVTATDAKTTKTLLSKAFSVKAAASPNSTLTITNYSYPTTLNEGTAYTIKGNVVSNYNINSVTVGLYNANGTAVSTKTINPNSKNYSLAGLAAYVRFNALKAGTNYYRVTATDSKKTATLLNKAIVVKAAEAESTLKLSNANYPTTLYKGEIFYAKGSVTSNYKISNVVYGIYNANGTAVSTAKVTGKSTNSVSLLESNYNINFHNLNKGTYYYKVTATDQKKTVTLANQKFTVKNEAKKISYKSYTTNYRSTFKDPNSKFTYKYSDEFFNFSSMVSTESSSADRMGKFATASCAMASAAYVRDHVTAALKNMGYSIIAQINYNEKGDKSVADIKNNDIIGYTVARKNIYVGGVKEYSIYALIVRGTNGYEWVSNFNMGTSGVHQGFQLAANKLYNSLNTYLKSIDKQRDKIWVTGHSRGAAVTNLLGVMLSKNQKFAKKENVHAYAFACPNTTSFADKSYKNVLNFNNEYDFVTNVALAKWNFSRNGVTYSVNETASNFAAIKSKFKSITTYTKKTLGISKTKSTAYKGLTKKQLDAIVNGMNKYCPNLSDYYKEYTYGKLIKKTNKPCNVFNTLGKTLSNALSWDTIDTLAVLFKGDPSSGIIINMVKGKGGITHAHCPEFYLAWMSVDFA